MEIEKKLVFENIFHSYAFNDHFPHRESVDSSKDSIGGKKFIDKSTHLLLKIYAIELSRLSIRLILMYYSSDIYKIYAHIDVKTIACTMDSITNLNKVL